MLIANSFAKWGCSTVVGCSNWGVTKTITLTANGIDLGNVDEIIQAEIGKEFTISLTANSSTGFSWYQENTAEWLDWVNITFTKDTPFVNGQMVVGSGSIETFSFKTSDKGVTIITMKYMRGGEVGEQRVFLVVSK